MCCTLVFQGKFTAVKPGSDVQKCRHRCGKMCSLTLLDATQDRFHPIGMLRVRNRKFQPCKWPQALDYDRYQYRHQST